MKKIISALLFIVFIAALIWFIFLKEETKKNIEENITNTAQQIIKKPSVIKTEIEVLAENLKTPWAIAFLPNNDILITERAGKVRLFKNGEELTEEPVIELTQVYEVGEGGLLGLDLHPNFFENNFIYLYYTYQEDQQPFNRVSRFTYQNEKLIDEEIIIDRLPAATYHNGGRIKFGPDGYLYITTGDAQEVSKAQEIDFLGGKILRLTDLGEPVFDNPFNNAVYSYGHRNSQGITWDRQGNLWSTEHGRSGAKSGFDELNLIVKGANYGWPIVEGDKIEGEMLAPNLHSGEDYTWAPAGAAAFENNIFFTGLRGEALYQVIINEENNELVLKEHFKGEFGRLRDVVVSPDGYLYLISNNTDGRGNPAENDDRLFKVAINLLP